MVTVIGRVVTNGLLSADTTATAEPLELGIVVDADVDELELFATNSFVLSDELAFVLKFH